MSAQPVTYDGMLETFRAMLQESAQEFDRKIDQLVEQMKSQSAEADRRKEEADKQMKENDERRAESDRKWEALRKQMKETDKRIGFVDERIGELVEGMVGSNNSANQFRDLGYDISNKVRNEIFGTTETETYGEIDLLLENDEVAILIEIKTKLTIGKILKHINRLEKYRRWHDKQGTSKNRYIGAIACALMKDEAVQFAHDNGMYVIAQLGHKIEIVKPPEGFKAKEW
jgi:Skp family chaperone for outer membrane proteins